MAGIHRRIIKKSLNDLDNHNGVTTHLEPDSLECEVKWALESLTMDKASRSDGILAELFQILKDDDVKVLYSVCQNLENSTVVTGHFHSNPKEGQCQRMCKLMHNYTRLIC